MFLDEAAVVERQAFSANEELQQTKTSDPALSCLGASLVSLCVRYRYTDKYLATEERQEGFPGARALKSKVQSMMAGAVRMRCIPRQEAERSESSCSAPFLQFTSRLKSKGWPRPQGRSPCAT